MRQRDEDLAKEVELLKQKIVEVEKRAKESALARVLNLKSSQTQAVKWANSSSWKKGLFLILPGYSNKLYKFYEEFHDSNL